MLTKDDYINLISAAGDRYGNKLVAMMDHYNVHGLAQLTLEQVKKYYEEELEI